MYQDIKKEDRLSIPILFFDENMPARFEHCNTTCVTDDKYFCKHRLCSKAHVIFLPKVIRHVRFFDIQVLLTFYYKIVSNAKLKRRSKQVDQKFILITADGPFLKSAKDEWNKINRSKCRTIHFGKDYVFIDALIRIDIYHPKGKDKFENIKDIVKYLDHIA